MKEQNEERIDAPAVAGQLRQSARPPFLLSETEHKHRPRRGPTGATTDSKAELPDRTAQPRLGYLLKAFPRISETFILNEILELERQGFDLFIYSMITPAEALRHRLADRVRSPITYLPYPLLPASHQVARAHLRAFLQHPLKYLAALWTVVWAFDLDLWERFVQAGLLIPELQRDRIDHVHAGFVHSPGSVGWLVHRITGLPFSLATHAKDLYHSPPRLLRKKLADARLVFTCTRYNVGNLRRLGPSGGIRCLQRVYHGTDLERFQYGPYGLATTPLILSVARFVEKKGLNYLIDACKVLRDQGRDFRCQIIGTGELKQDLLDAIQHSGLQDVVALDGPLDQHELQNFYRQATVFVLPSVITSNGDRDGIPNVLVEAAAVGLPIVSTDVSGIPELIRHRETGLVVPPRNVSALAEALTELLDDAPLCERLRLAAREYIEKEFDLRKNAQRIGSHLRQAMGNDEIRASGLSPTMTPRAEFRR